MSPMQRAGGTAIAEREMIRHLYPSLLRFASAVRPPGEDGNDLVQEAFVRVLQRAGSLSSLDNPGAYLRRTIVNLVMDHHRRQRRSRVAWSRLGPSRDEVVPTYSWELESLRAVSPKARAVLYLHVIEGWSYEDIGEVLSCSPISARVAASRGKRQLHITLAKEADDAVA